MLRWGPGTKLEALRSGAGKFLAVGMLLASALARSGNAQVVLNEVMFDPSGSEYYDEFVELLNTGPDTVNLAGWRLGDDSELDAIVDAGEGLELAPGQFALVLDPGYFGHSTTYDSLIPPSALVVTIDDGAFGKGGFSNSSPETVFLVNANGDTVGAYRYSLGNRPGFSDEKIDPGGGDGADDWADARVYLGTPGFENSVARKETDLALAFVAPDTLVVANPREIRVKVAVRNAGMSEVREGTVLLWWDCNADGQPSGNERLGQTDLPPLASGDSTTVEFTWSPPGRGLYFLRARVSASGDDYAGNDIDSLFVVVPCPAGQVVINEIYYRPAAGEPEWVELYNCGPDPVSLAGWWLSDGTRRGTVRLELDAAARLLPPRGYAVLTESVDFPGFAGLRVGTVLEPGGGFPSLNNSGDVVVVRDALGTAVDSLRYRASWGGENGVSLERVRPCGNSTNRDNWRTCAAASGSTPGSRNSVSPPERALQLALRPGSGPCTRAGQEVQIHCVVHSVGLTGTGAATLGLRAERVDPCGAEVATPGDFDVPELGPLDSLVLPVSWTPHTPGRWVIRGFLQTADSSTQVDTATATLWVSPSPGDVVVNEIQFDPPPGQAEWVEVYNRGSHAVSLDRWWLGDSRRRVPLDSIGACLDPGTYALILPAEGFAPDGLQPGTPVWRVLHSWPGLSNSGDAVALVDPCGVVIDSVFYRSSWGRGGGSLERVLASGASADSSNWAACSDPAGATPGRLNSATPRDVDLAVVGVRWPGVRVAEGCSVTVVVANVGRNRVSIASVRVVPSDRAPDAVRAAAVPALDPGDTVEVTVPATFEEPGWVQLLTAVVCEADTRRENDSTTVRMYVSPPFGAVTLNELYVTPLAGQVEWVEIANTSQWDLSLRGWSVADARGAIGAGVVRDSLVLAAGGMAILAADSSVLSSWSLSPDDPFAVPDRWPGFNDDGDLVRLADPAGLVSDTVRYARDWGIERGYSLEKLRPKLPSAAKSSWTRCTDPAGGTPGAPNSVFAYTMPGRAAISVQPNPFSPDGDGHEDVAVFSLTFPSSLVAARLRIFDVAGRRVRELLADEPCGPHRLVVWDGRDDQGRPCRVGPYVALLEWRTADGRSGVQRQVVVVAW